MAAPGLALAVAPPWVRTITDLCDWALETLPNPDHQDRYRPPLAVLRAAHGTDPVDGPTARDLTLLLGRVEEEARRRRAGGTGAAARDHHATVWRYAFGCAVAAGLRPDNPASGLRMVKHRRIRPLLDPAHLDEVRDAALGKRCGLPGPCGKPWQPCPGRGRHRCQADGFLDLCLVELIWQCAATRSEASEVTVADLDHRRQGLWLGTGGARRFAPTTLTLLADLTALAAVRGSTGPADPVFRIFKIDSDEHLPMSFDHFDYLFRRVRTTSQRARAVGLNADGLRLSALQAVERLAGPDLAALFGGHRPRGGISGAVFVAEDHVGRVAVLFERLTGERHPLAI